MKYVLALIVVGCLSVPCRAQDEPAPPLPPELAARLGELLGREWKERPEWADMASVILKNEPMSYGKGWFTGAKSRYHWKWLTETFPEETADRKIARDELPQLTEADFKRLDRNGDGSISPMDLDWSKGNPMMAGFSPSDMVFDKLDLDFNGRLTRDELMKLSTGERLIARSRIRPPIAPAASRFRSVVLKISRR